MTVCCRDVEKIVAYEDLRCELNFERFFYSYDICG